MVLPQAMAWVQYWFRVLSLKFCGKSKKICGDISQVSPAFCMYVFYHCHSVQTTVQIIVFSIPFFENTAWLWSMLWTGWVSTPASPRYPAGVSSPTHCDHLLVHITTTAVATIIDVTTHHHLKNCDHLLLHVTDLELALSFSLKAEQNTI